MAVVYDPDSVYVRALKLFLSEDKEAYDKLRNLTYNLLENEGYEGRVSATAKEDKVVKVRLNNIIFYTKLVIVFYLSLELFL